MTVKGKYVCMVEIDFDFQYREGMLPFEKIRDKTVNGELTDIIRDVIVDKVMDREYGTVTITQQYADLYKVEGEQDGKDT